MCEFRILYRQYQYRRSSRHSDDLSVLSSAVPTSYDIPIYGYEVCPVVCWWHGVWYGASCPPCHELGAVNLGLRSARLHACKPELCSGLPYHSSLLLCHSSLSSLQFPLSFSCRRLLIQPLSSGLRSFLVHIRHCSMSSGKHPASFNCLPTEYLLSVIPTILAPSLSFSRP